MVLIEQRVWIPASIIDGNHISNHSWISTQTPRVQRAAQERQKAVAAARDVKVQIVTDDFSYDLEEGIKP